MVRIPNIPDDTAADGMEEEDAQTISTWGEPPEFGFEPKDHLDAGRARRPGADRHRGRRPGLGRRFHYLMGDLVRLEFALVQWGLDKLVGHGFTPVIPPVLVREAAMEGTGFFPEAREQVYEVPRDELFLVGTAEVPLASLHGGKVLDAEDELPLRYVGFSTCFRREAGAAGKDTRGIFRVHQFDKLEMFVYTLPEESNEPSTTGCWRSRRRSPRSWASTTACRTSPSATWARRRPRSTTSRSGCPARSATAS